MRSITIIALLLLALGSPEARAGTELNFWHAYIHAKTDEKHFSFNLASYRRGLFFGSCGLSTRSQLWFFTFDLAGAGPVYSANEVTLTSDEPKNIAITGGTVIIDLKNQRAIISLQVAGSGTENFVGNGNYRIHPLK